MIDLHCHFLPGVDDGPKTLSEALDLARAACADGITHSVLTAHVHPGRYTNQRSNLKMVFDSFCEELIIANIPLNVRLGSEAHICHELIDLVAKNQVPFIGEVDGYRILLLEFPDSTIPLGSNRFVGNLLKLKIRPLVAHPERNKAVMAHPEKIDEFALAGCWFQLTAGSLAGRFGNAAKQTAFKIIDAGWNCLVATDAHNLQHRPPLLSKGLDALRECYGEDLAHSLVIEKPAKIWGLPQA